MEHLAELKAGTAGVVKGRVSASAPQSLSAWGSLAACALHTTRCMLCGSCLAMNWPPPVAGWLDTRLSHNAMTGLWPREQRASGAGALHMATATRHRPLLSEEHCLVAECRVVCPASAIGASPALGVHWLLGAVHTTPPRCEPRVPTAKYLAEEKRC